MKTLFNLFLSFSLTVISFAASAQCAFNNTFYLDLTPTAPSYYAETACAWGGDLITVSVVAGETYVFSTCLTDDLFDGDDSQLTLYNATGTTVLGYSDDAGCGWFGGLSEITWTATYTGTANLLVDEYNCSNATFCYNVSVECITCSAGPGSLSEDCSSLSPICTSTGLSFTATASGTNASTVNPGNNYNCLITQPDPTWYYLEIATSGNINMNLYALQDVDYIIYGPFANLTAAQAGCESYGYGGAGGAIEDCSFNSTNNEFPDIIGAVAGEVYVMMITNYAGVIQNVTLEQVGGLGSTDCSIVGCNAYAGTYALTLQGAAQPAGTAMYLCYSQCMAVTSNNDYVLPTPNCGVSELMYAIYTTAPSGGDPNTDPGWSGYFWTGEDFSDCNNGSSVFNTVPALSGFTTYWLVPITVDDGDDDGNGSGGCPGLDIDLNGDGCYALGQPIEMHYLNQIAASGSMNNCTGVATITVTGGLPQDNGSNYTITNTGPGTLTGTPITHGGSVTVTGLTNGQSVTLTITDGKGCSLNYTYGPVTVTTPANAGTNGSITLCSNGASVNLYSSLGGTPQTTGTWSGGLTGGYLGTYNPVTFAPGTYTYTVAGSGGCPNATATVTVTENTAANAGTDGSTSVCDNNGAAINLFSLIGGEQAGGTWTQSTGTGGTFNAGAGTFTPAAGATTSTFTYTITGAAPCPNDQSVATITITAAPNAGADGSTTVCDNSVAAIDLFSLITGEQAGGTWIRNTGTGGTFNAAGGTYTPAAGATSSTFTYTVTGTAPCANDQSVATITIVAAPNAGTDGSTSVCDNNIAAINLFSLIGGEQVGGTWVQTTGTGGTFNAGAGTYTPAAGATTSTFTYTVTGTAPCANDQSIATINITAAPNAGADGSTTICDNSVAVVDLFSLITGEQAGGAWIRNTGTGGTFNAAAGTFTPTAGATSSTFTYTVTGIAPCANDQSVATITIVAAPNAGSDGSTSVCDNNLTAINLFSLITGEQAGGTWTQTTGSGGTFNAGAGTYTPASGATTSTFTYTVNGTAPCANDQSVATVNITAAPNAGADGSTAICDNSVAVIDLFSLISGEQAGGTWVQTTGTGGTFNAGAGTYTPASGATTSTFTYTVNGVAPCTNDQSVATITISAAPNAGTDGSTSICDNSVATIDLFSLITGEQAGGTWTQTTGAGGTFNAGAGTFTPATGATTSTFTYTVAGVAPCVNDQSVATITITAAPNAGTDGGTTVCESSAASIDLFSLISGEQGGGTWTQTSGSGGTFNAGAGTFTPGAGATTSSFTYTVTGVAPCVNDQSLVTINITSNPYAGVDGSMSVCDNNTSTIDLFSLITGEQLGGTWTQTSGTGGTFSAAAGTFVPAVGATTSTFTYTVAGGAPCIDDASIVTINITAAPNAGTDGSTAICDNNLAVINLFSLISGEQVGGTWTQTSGTGGTFNAGAGTFTPAAGATTSTFAYTLTGTAPCVDDQSIATITINPAPNAGIDGSTAICDNNVAVIDLFSLISGEQAGGTWTQTSGTGGAFNAGAGTFTPAAGATSSTFTYTIAGIAPCITDQSVATVTITAAPNAGLDGSLTICDNSVAPIDLFSLISGEQAGGTWTQTSGTGGTFNAGAGTYTPAVGATSSSFAYTVTGIAPCVDDVSAVNITITGTLDAGLDGATSVCENNTATIDLFSLITGEQLGGTWTQTSGTGGTFNAGAGTFIPAVGATTSTFTYTLSGTAPCIDDQSVATVNIIAAPIAGTDGSVSVCENDLSTIDLSTLISGEQAGGVWTQTSGTGGSFNAGGGSFTPAIGATTSTFTYTLTGTSPCANDQSVATITITATPNAGTDGTSSVCENNTATIDLYSLIGGEQTGGTWTQTAGSGGIFNAAAGTYTPAIGATSSSFMYTVTGSAPCTDDQSMVNITITAAPIAGTDGSTSICENSISSIDLYSLISGEQAGGTWTQTSGSGGTFNAAGGTFTPGVGATTSTFTYTVSGTAPCADDQSIATVNITAAPNAGIDGSLSICDNSVTSIDLNSLLSGAQAGGAWTQTSGAGGTFNAGTGTYTPTIGTTTSTFDYTINGVAPCTNDVSQVTLTITSAPNAGIDGSTSVCESSVATIDLFSLISGEQGGGVWTLTSGSGGTFNAGTGTFTPAVGAVTSTFTYTVSGTAPCVDDQSTATVTITPTPNAGVDGSTTVCENNTSMINLLSLITGGQAGGTWAQTSGTGGTFNAGAGTFTPAVGATNSTFTYTVSGSAPCTSDQSVVSINITPAPVAGTDGSLTICEGDVTVIDLFAQITGGQAGGTWTQTSGTGGSFDATNGTFTPSAGTSTTSVFTYTVAGTAPCSDDISTVTINVNQVPDAGLDGNVSVCESSATAVDLTSLITNEQGGGVWTQTTGTGGTFDSNAGTFVPSMGATTSTFTYTVAGISPCVDDQSIATVTITPAPSAPYVDKDAIYCLTDTPSAMTIVGGGGTYTWYTDAALTNSLGTGASYIPTVQLGTQTYYVTETNGTCTGLAGTATIEFIDCDTSTIIVIPTAFTPNGDSDNDIWELVDIDKVYPKNKVFIYNRWGNLLYESVEGSYSSSPWDGKVKGDLLPVGSYYYIIYSTGDDSGEIFNGTVTIIKK